MVKKIICIIGTRPEAIKMAPVILSLKSQSWANVRVVVTAQHRDMLDQMLALFKIKPDIDLNIMEHNQSLPHLSAKILVQLDNIFRTELPDAVIAQGDTTTTFISALAAFYLNIPFYHIEAGLRSGDMKHPFPEEMNRVLVAPLTNIHFAPTLNTKNNLLAEGVPAESIFITGNTIIDALRYIADQPINSDLNIDPSKRLILVTCHRRESFGTPLKELCIALRKLINEFADVQILFPVHPNPNVSQVVYQELGQLDRILLMPPLDYITFIATLKQTYLILTDSGGVQEEAPAFGKPILVLRDTTERIEGIQAGVAKLVRLNAQEIFRQTAELLNFKDKYQSMAKTALPYGDGTAAQQIVTIIKEKLVKRL
jgi:UDP-N-acetylglucosamine 2-epimerase (non-hydrolysing)